MSRQKRLRKIIAPPNFSGYKPFGCRKKSKDSIELYYEEYEAIKLSDYDLLDYERSAVLMGVSRATFARIYESARRKIAKALVDTKEIRALPGNVYLDNEWCLCNDCKTRFELKEQMSGNNCPVCRSENVNPLKITI